MLRFILKRVLLAISQLFAISLIAFTLLYLSSGDIARAILGQYATEEQVRQKTQELGLDRPLIVRYGEWLGNVLQGDLGQSYFTPQSVGDALLTRLPVTLTLLIATTVLAGLIAFALGVAAGVRRGWLDRLIQVVSVVGYALPGFLVALLLVLTFAVDLGWFPATGYVPFADDPAGWV
ncbi:ABC transporter permease [Streptomyces sp. NPDC004838]